MNARVLVLHGYSSENAGDGLLVKETLDIIRQALGEVEITLLASRPETFTNLNATVLPTVPRWMGWDRRTRETLGNIDAYKLVVAVGGGYLRAGTPKEFIKTALVHGPQLFAAMRTSAPTVYLPQSIGPARFGTRYLLKRVLRSLDVVMVRDDRTLAEVDGPTLVRTPDLAAAAAVAGRQPRARVNEVPVLSIRAVHGKVPARLHPLAARLGPYDGYIQSTTGGNDDRPAAATLSPRQTLSQAKLMTPGDTPRVVVAVRLHAALMALAAGHYVVHLAYERKGFGAFDDLGIGPWVHSVNSFEPTVVESQVQQLLANAGARADYDARIESASERIIAARGQAIELLRRRGEGR